MIAFHGDKKVKARYLKRVRDHMAADELVRGTGFDPSTNKGCAVGCTLNDYNHVKYETELGIPEWLARLEDRIFEGMNLEKSRTWPEKFLRAIWTGADLEQAAVPIICMILEHSITSIRTVNYATVKFPQVKATIEQTEAAVAKMIHCHREGLDLSEARLLLTAAAKAAAEVAAGLTGLDVGWANELVELAAESVAWVAWAAARSAGSAAWAAEWAARSAGSAAEWAAERSAAEWAAESAEWAAGSAAWAAGSAAWLTGWSAVWAVEAAARSAAYDYYADEVLSILRKIRPTTEGGKS